MMNGEKDEATRGEKTGLVTLNYSGCKGVTGEGLASLAAALPAACKLEMLQLQGCTQIEDSGVVPLGVALLENTTLTCVDLSWCELLTDASLEALAAVAKFHFHALKAGRPGLGSNGCVPRFAARDGHCHLTYALLLSGGKGTDARGRALEHLLLILWEGHIRGFELVLGDDERGARRDAVKLLCVPPHCCLAFAFHGLNDGLSN